MRDAMQIVREFHVKHGFPVNVALEAQNEVATRALRNLGEIVASVGKHFLNMMEAGSSDSRLLRAHLMCEELAETMRGLEACDPTKLLDGLADLTYVVVGTAVTYGLPLPQGVTEVHASNMTKERQPSDPAGFRIRDKGPGWQPPQLESLLRYWREPKRCRADRGDCAVAPCPLACPGRPIGAC